MEKDIKYEKHKIITQHGEGANNDVSHEIIKELEAEGFKVSSSSVTPTVVRVIGVKDLAE